jgi:hypothetical protein
VIDDDEEVEASSNKSKRTSRTEMLANDIDNLMLSPAFRRFIYCVLMDANVLRGGHGANPATLPWWEGRRSLGLDILATLQTRDPYALLAILTEEKATGKDTQNGRRTDRRDELRTDPDGRTRSDGYQFLDYGPDASGPAAG